MIRTPKSLQRWLRCKKCRDLAAWRRNVIVGVGRIPAKILFIGEAPGKTEDLLGEPFVGRSGQLFRQARKDAVVRAGLSRVPSCYITNVLACRPCDERHGPNRMPRPQEIERCRPRVAEIMALVRPEAIVFLGKVPEQNLRQFAPDGVALRHPAYVTRRGGIGSTEYRIFVSDLADVFLQIEGR